MDRLGIFREDGAFTLSIIGLNRVRMSSKNSETGSKCARRDLMNSNEIEKVSESPKKFGCVQNSKKKLSKGFKMIAKESN